MRAIGCASLLMPALAILAAAGCHAPPQPTGPTLATVPAQDPEALDHLWQSTEDMLLRFNFKLDRRDRQAGVLTTHPETSASWFEIWRVQPRPSYYWAESNMQTIQRQVEIHLRPMPLGIYEVQVQVERYRYDLPERQVDNAAGAMRLYSGAAPTLSGQKTKGRESGRWIRLGRDGAMEQALLNAILHRYSLPPAATAPAS
jgi:hypothetical protein